MMQLRKSESKQVKRDKERAVTVPPAITEGVFEMMYITYGNTKVSVNIALLKSRIKSIVMWVLKAMRTTAVISGIFLLLGTAGSSDLDLITFTEMLYNLGISLLLFGIAYVVEFIKVIME